jgi:hypothetical protein
MSAIIINSEVSLQSTLSDIKAMFFKHKYLRISIKTGKDRSLDQNALSHTWYAQIARELKEDDALGWKCFCKLHFGIPILRAEDAEFRKFYDNAIRSSLSYEQKLIAMQFLSVTSEMTKPQLSAYLEAMQAHFRTMGVQLEFPEANS